VRATSDEIRRIGGGSGSESQTARLTTASKASVTRFEGGSQGERLASRGLNVSHVCDSVTEHNSLRGRTRDTTYTTIRRDAVRLPVWAPLDAPRVESTVSPTPLRPYHSSQYMR
jgi:hypothetical protein